MMHRLLLGSCVALGLAACATHPAAPTAGDSNSMPAAVPAWQPPAAASRQEPPAGCVSTTATRLPVAPGDCAGVGSQFSGKDVQRTGQQQNLGTALQMLDPIIHP